ncbi:porin [Hydrogenovibrio kuenenii]|uniref:porin n=1 Tax=Hydrogenovibrio kuenenii TaxID=63658 RepID=UPI0004658B81|nr:porin [Hydrogenovibrio kuenenii]
MKKNIIALAVASAIAAPVAMADAPTVFGKINQAFQVSKEVKNAGVKDHGLSGMAIKSYASRLGFKGSEDLGNGLKAVYHIEYGVSMSDSSTSVSNRNQFAGLAGSFGTVIMGRHDTPYKMAQGYDAFNDKEFDNNWSQMGVFGDSGEKRADNVLAYVSPNLGGVKVIAAFVPKENSGDTTKDSSITDIISAAVTYGSKKKGLYLSGAMDSLSKNANAAQKGGTDMRLVAQYSVAGLTANATYANFSGDAVKNTYKEGTDMSVNVAYKMGKITPRLKYAMADRKVKTLKDGTGMGVGVDYSLSKTVKTYADYMSVTNLKGVDKTDTSAVNVGLVVKF